MLYLQYHISFTRYMRVKNVCKHTNILFVLFNIMFVDLTPSGNVPNQLINNLLLPSHYVSLLSVTSLCRV